MQPAMKRFLPWLNEALVLCGCVCFLSAAEPARLSLNGEWQMASAQDDPSAGEQISLGN